MNIEGNPEPNLIDEDTITFRCMNYTVEKRIVHRGPEPGVYPKLGALVTIHFRGVVGPNNKIVEDVMNYQCHLGDFDLVDGLEIALLSMKQGEQATLSMDFAFGYGIFGLKSNTGAYIVPPYAKLRYIVELLSIEDEILEEIDDNEILLRKFAFKKARGDFWLKRLEFYKAIHSYKRALNYLLRVDDDIMAIGRAAGLPLTNTGIVKLVLRRKQFACRAAVNESRVMTTLQRDPRNTQALFHVAKILKLMGETKLAYASMKTVTQLDRDHRDAAAEADAMYYYLLRKRFWRVFHFFMNAMGYTLLGLILIVVANHISMMLMKLYDGF